MSDDLDDVALPPVETDPAFVAAVEDAMSGGAVELDVNRTLGADPHDFAGLYIRHRSSFASHARRFLRDPRDVDEVVQEAFLRLFLALPELSTELQALAYCRRTVTNLCIDRYRADKRRPRLVNIEALPPNDFPDEQIDDPVVQAEDAAFVREALALLSPLHRDALVKREIEEKSLPVIAAELGVPEESVKHLLHRARRALRRHLAKTHLAPGADLETTSTLSLLAKSAATGGGRLGVIALFTLAVLVGTKPELPATALTSWPLDDLLPAVTHALTPRVPAPRTHPVRTDAHPAAPLSQARVPLRSGGSRADDDLALPKPFAVHQPIASTAPLAQVLPSTSAAAVVATTAPHASGTPTPHEEPTPRDEPSTTPTTDGTPKPSASPSGSDKPEPARAQSSPTPDPEAGETDGPVNRAELAP